MIDYSDRFQVSDYLRHCVDRGDDGRDEWNVGRREHGQHMLESVPEPLTLTLSDGVEVSLEPPNLWLADLQGLDLSGYDLSGAFLSGAHLEGAMLDGCNLSDAHLIVTGLGNAKLRGANLSRANRFSFSQSARAKPIL